MFGRETVRRLIGIVASSGLVPVRLFPCTATEQQSMEHVLEVYPKQKRDAARLIATIIRILKPKSSDLRVLEVGAAQGAFVIACNELGYFCRGIEPSENALSISRVFAKARNVGASIEKAAVEELPYADATFDIVVALSVIEHVINVKKAFSEIFRVLKPRGAFYFWTANSLCPYQDEVRFFPFFSWYHDGVKQKVLLWTLRHRPSWVGYTKTPAINWFSPWKANTLLREAGFTEVWDRWSLLARGGESFKYASVNLIASRVARRIESTSFTRLWAEILVTGCGYLAIKT